jgi:hypothetical protein
LLVIALRKHNCSDKRKFYFFGRNKIPSNQMSMLSFEKYKISDTVDVAYFEPLSERFYGNHFKEESVVVFNCGHFL